MTLSYTQIEEFNQIKIILSCDYLCHSLIIVQARYSLLKTNQQAHTCSLFSMKPFIHQWNQTIILSTIMTNEK